MTHFRVIRKPEEVAYGRVSDDSETGVHAPAHRMSDWRRKLLSVAALLAMDAMGFILSVVLAYYTRRGLSLLFPIVTVFDLTFRDLLKYSWIGGIFLSVMAYERMYSKRCSFWDEPKELIKVFTLSTVILFAVISFGRFGYDISRLTVFLLWIYGIVILSAFRMVGKRILYNLGVWRENILIVGAGSAGRETAQGICRETHMGYRIMGFLDDDPGKIGGTVEIESREYPVVDRIDNFRKHMHSLDVKKFCIAIPSLSPEQLICLTNRIYKHADTVILVPALKGIALLNTELLHLFSEKLYILKMRNSLRSPVNRFLKRIFDAVLCIVLFPLVLPMILLIGLLIRIDSSGPVFFTHMRVGRNGRPFRIIKFRSMYRDAQDRFRELLDTDEHLRKEWEAHYKIKNDPRITRIGRFLRATSLDELPQIFNVLKGEMSFVGPRPVLQDELDQYYREFTEYYCMVPPGITGLWQISGRSNTNYDIRVKMDTWYVMNWTLWFDIVILFKTVRIVLQKEGAY